MHIHDWNYWWCVYHCANGWDDPDAAEFCLTEDEVGEKFYFRLDFYNLSALHQMIQDGEFIEPENPDYFAFLKQEERLRNGEQDWFIGAIYYPNVSPNFVFCNTSNYNSLPLTKLFSSSELPYYGVIFIREERPLLPKVLTTWVERLSLPLFGESFFCRFSGVPTLQDALESYEKEIM